MTVNYVNAFALTLIVGLVSACGSGNDTAPDDIQAPIVTESPLSDDSAEGTDDGVLSEPDVTETDPDEQAPNDPATDESVFDQTGEGTTQDANPDTSESSPDADPQVNGEQENTDLQGQADPETEDGDSEQPAENQQRANFGAPELFIDLVSDGSSFPAKFHRSGDNLYFWTVDEDPRFARCAPHWGWLNDDDKNIGLNFIAAHPVTGVVEMNRRMMTVGDFATDINNACAGYNGTIMHIFDQVWHTSPATNGGQQFVLHFNSYGLGPNQIWQTDGSEANTNVMETGLIDERMFVEGDKFFFVNSNGLSVADTLSGERRSLFQANDVFYTADIQQIAKSPARKATFEIMVSTNRYQIWMYDLDTEEWEKTFSIKPDDSTYSYRKTLLVNGQTVLSLGRNERAGGGSVLGISSNYGDVTSFEILTDAAPSPYGNIDDDVNNDELVYSAEGFVWRYRDERIERLFAISDPDIWNAKVIAGHNGHVYFTAIKNVGEWPETSVRLKLWAYDSQSEQLAELSNDNWYAMIGGHPTPDEGYVFRYLNTPDGLIFVNLTEDSGRELWFTDGTAAGTRLLADINPGSADSNPENYYHSGDAIYFSADDGVHGHEPWRIPVSR